MKAKIGVVVFILIGLISCSSRSEFIQGGNLLALEGANLFDGTGTPLISDSAVVIREGKIIRIGKVGDFRYPEDATVLDLEDHYILPGFINTHVHLTSVAIEEVLKTFLAFGITTIMDAAAVGGEGFLLELRNKLSSGELTGPRMLTAGQAIDGHSVWDNYPFISPFSSEDDVREEVRRQVEQGVDIVKVYSHLPSDLMAAAIEEAHAHGLKVLGHLGKTSWTQAAEMGIDFICHSAHGGPIWELVAPDRQPEFQDHYIPGPVELKDYDAALLRAWRDLVDLNGPEMERLTSSLIKNEVLLIPTIVTYTTMTWGNDPETRESLEPDFAPEYQRNRWSKTDVTIAEWTEEHFKESVSSWPLFMDIVRILYKKNIPFAAGTDYIMTWITPGVSLHREMELLADVGIPSPEVLRIATRNGAEMLGILEETGTIEVGKDADIVVLSEDPIDDIRNTRSIEAVIKNGQIYKPTDLLTKNN